METGVRVPVGQQALTRILSDKLKAQWRAGRAGFAEETPLPDAEEWLAPGSGPSSQLPPGGARGHGGDPAGPGGAEPSDGGVAGRRRGLLSPGRDQRSASVKAGVLEATRGRFECRWSR